jgi:hypothetical protein
MRILSLTGFACVVALVQCKTRQFVGGSEVKGEKEAITQVDARFLNAFNIWRDGEGTPTLEYPADYVLREYNVSEEKVAPDGVFYLSRDIFFADSGKFLGTTTEGAKVEGDLLTYPEKNGRNLALKFSPVAANTQMLHADAVQYCKSLGLRLPHIQEIFDFCAAGTEKDPGSTFTGGNYSSRCTRTHLWSASLYSAYRTSAWIFSPIGYVNDSTRKARYGVQCVGVVQ